MVTKLYLLERKLPISPYIQTIAFFMIPVDGLKLDDSLRKWSLYGYKRDPRMQGAKNENGQKKDISR